MEKNAICTKSHNEAIVLIGKVRTFLEHFLSEVVNFTNYQSLSLS